MAGPAGNLLVQKILMSDDPLKELMEGVEEVKEVGREKLAGIPTTIVELMQPVGSLGTGMVPGGAGEDMPIKVRLWIGKKDFLIRKVAFELDMGRMAEGMPEEQRAMMEGMKMGFTERHTAVEVDPTFSDEIFTFAPPEGAQLVEQFVPPGGPSRDKSEFVGKPAPGFVLKDIEDKEVKLADFEGKVLIVNFWAT